MGYFHLGRHAPTDSLRQLSESLDGIKHDFGQSMLYRLRSKFVLSVFICAERHKDAYSKERKEEERVLDDLFKYLSDEANVFLYAIPAFTAAPSLKC